MEPKIGLKAKDRKTIVDGLSRVLADSYVLALKTQNFHWNVKGSFFGPLHAMFEEQYDELSDSVDDLAERIRALGADAPGSFSAFAKLTSVAEAKGGEKAEAMIADLLKGQEQIIATARKVQPAIEAAGDDATFDMLNEVIFNRGKNAWMLRAQLES